MVASDVTAILLEHVLIPRRAYCSKVLRFDRTENDTRGTKSDNVALLPPNSIVQFNEARLPRERLRIRAEWVLNVMRIF